jgi:hypothetical protein
LSRFYKFLAPGARGRFTGHEWPAPAGAGVDAWVQASGPVEQCVSGVHVCRLQDLPRWLDAELWEVETAGEPVVEERQVLVQRARLVRRIDPWTERTAYDFGLDCMRRAQTAAAETLGLVGLAIEADGLLAADEPEDVLRRGHEASTAAEQGGHRIAARVAYAAGTAGYHMAVAPGSSPGYVAYPAFSAYASTVVADSLEPDGYETERARQAAWLAARLDLG